MAIISSTIPRGPDRQLRVRWRELKGHYFLELREWSVNPHNSQWWPEKGKRIIIKARKLAAIKDAIERILGIEAPVMAAKSHGGPR